MDYELEHLHEYDKNLLIDIIKYLHTELYNKGNQQSQPEQPEQQPKDEWLLGK
jgi:hypothetical protein